ncbi:PPE family protein [Mycobacterium sp. 050134]|uniref:PPE family protein n=1 Tax=Mycobacterium sp. 050134 TaxID=3096111 RepID=UPI002ED906D8
MTSPIWIASPPEVHSALLSSGPGVGPLLAAAGAWDALSAEYATVAAELSATLASAQAGAWEGPSAESYVAAHGPFLAWLTQAGTDSAEMAASHQTMAAAYTTALAAMPTLPELAANHVVHSVLLATNFFGINTVPIAINEADYARMWVQAATTMAGYEAISSATAASAPRTVPAPQIVKSDAQAGAQPSAATNPLQAVEQFLQNFVQQVQNLGQQIQNFNPFTEFENAVNNPQLDAFLQQFGIGNDAVAHDPVVDNPLDDFIANILRNFGYNWNPAEGTVNGLDYDSYTDPTTAAFWVVRSLELGEDFQQFFVLLQTNPVAAIQYLVSLELFDWPTHLAEIFTLTSQPAALAAALPVAAAPLASVGGLAGLAGLAALPQPVVAPAVPLAPPPVLPAVAMAPTLTSVAGVAPSPPSAPSPSGPPAPAGPAPTPPPAGAGPAAFFPPYAVGPPGIGFGSGMSAGASAGAKRKAPEAEAAAAAAAASAREAARARRRQRQRQRDHADEFADMNVEVDPDWSAPDDRASDSGAGMLGFTGTAREQRVAGAVGLTTLAADDLGAGPRSPMLPSTWAAEERGGG